MNVIKENNVFFYYTYKILNASAKVRIICDIKYYLVL